MKVVLFCGGFGMRLRGYSESIPKPLVSIGYRPILWHVMKYYAHYGHRDFVLCLGWKANEIKNYFLNYNECLSNDFVMTNGGQGVKLLGSDIADWNITFCDTGVSASVGERLKAVQKHVSDDETFLANYSDGLTDACLPSIIDFHSTRDSVATFLSVRPTQTFHTVVTDDDGLVRKVEAISKSDVWMNGGFFVLSNKIFDYLGEGMDLVEGTFDNLMQCKRLYSIKHDGFWGCMDTYKEFEMLQDMHDSEVTPWAVWKHKKTLPIKPGT